MLNSMYDFDVSLKYKMDILEREGKTTWIKNCFSLDENGEPKDEKPVLCKYNAHDMIVRLPYLFRDELIFLYKHSPDQISPSFHDEWVKWLNCDTEAEIAIYDPKTLLNILNKCGLLNDRRLIDLVDTMFGISIEDHDKKEKSIMIIDSAIKTTNAFKRTKDFGFLMRTAREKFTNAYKYYLTLLPKKKEIKELPDEKRLVIETRLNNCLYEMCLSQSWENAKILIKRYGATISANYYEDFANKDYIRDFSKDTNYQVVLKHLQKAKEEKEEANRINLKNVVVRQPSKDELYGKQDSKYLD